MKYERNSLEKTEDVPFDTSSNMIDYSSGYINSQRKIYQRKLVLNHPTTAP
jgi:hypothetical protein